MLAQLALSPGRGLKGVAQEYPDASVRAEEGCLQHPKWLCSAVFWSEEIDTGMTGNSNPGEHVGGCQPDKYSS